MLSDSDYIVPVLMFAVIVGGHHRSYDATR
jgi:hypothetical protein